MPRPTNAMLLKRENPRRQTNREAMIRKMINHMLRTGPAESNALRASFENWMARSPEARKKAIKMGIIRIPKEPRIR